MTRAPRSRRCTDYDEVAGGGTRRSPARRGRAGRARGRDGDALRRRRQGGADARSTARASSRPSSRRPPRSSERRRARSRRADDELRDRRGHPRARRRARSRRAARLQPVRVAAARCVGRAVPRRATGHASLYAPGHGDLFEALRRSGTLAALRERGVRVVTVSNVDNLGARVDPVVVGAHLAAGRPLTCEVARKEGDMGGAPVRVDGKLQLVEGPRFPDVVRPGARPGLQHEHGALRSRCARTPTTTSPGSTCSRTVDGREAVQLERLYHEVSAFVPTQYLEVPRRGPARTVPADQDAGRPRARRGRPARARLGTDLTRSRDALRPYGRERAGARPRAPRALRGLRGARAARCATTCRASFTRLVPPVCERCGSPGPWPVRRCAECAGRRLAFAERAVGHRLRRTGASVRPRLEGARSPAARTRRGRLVAEVVPAAGRRRASCPCPAIRSAPGIEATSRRARSRSSSAGSGAAPIVDVLRAKRERFRGSAACRSRSVAATSAGAWSRALPSRATSVSSTTSTRPARRWTHARRRADAPAPAASEVITLARAVR